MSGGVVKSPHRFNARITTKRSGAARITLGQFLLAWIRVGQETENLLYYRVLKRTLHFFAQRLDTAILEKGSKELPAPQAGKQHPFEKYFRRTGGKRLLQVHLANRFMARGGGFVSLKEEKSLLELDLVPKTSNIAHKTAADFVGLNLLKQMGICQEVLSRSSYPVVNFCCDAARVFKMQACSMPKSFQTVLFKK